MNHQFDTETALIPRITAHSIGYRCSNCGDSIPKGADMLFIDPDLYCGAEVCGHQKQREFDLSDFLHNLDNYPIIREFLTLGWAWLSGDLTFSYEDQLDGDIYNLGPVEFEAENIEKKLGFYEIDCEDNEPDIEQIINDEVPFRCPKCGATVAIDESICGSCFDQLSGYGS